ncbi:MAG: flagellar basal-body rod protein FlgG [Desulfovibrionaceae bacterium]
MIRAMSTGATGMRAQEQLIDVIANNIANANTVSFKKSAIEFQDLLYDTERLAGSPANVGATPVGIQIGMGVRTAAVYKIFTQGDFQNTGNAWNLAIEGEGFFQVLGTDGTEMYTRAGAFQLNEDGTIVTPDGYPLQPEFSVPEGTKNVVIGPDGTLTATDSEGEIIATTDIRLYTFINPAGLDARGRNLYTPTEASGDPVEGTPGEDNFGTIAQGFLEMSNVSIVEDMVDMIRGQRAYEMNSKVIQTADAMLQTSANLKR